MENNVEMQTQRAILVGVQIGPRDIEYYMKELEQLAEAAGLEVAGVMTQKAERVNPATYMGKGKLEELQESVQTLEADVVVLNNELSGRQIRNLEDATGVKVIDRTILILDIFAARAVSREGSVPHRRRNRHPGSRRKEAGDRPAAHCPSDRRDPPGDREREGYETGPAFPPQQIRTAHRSHRRLHQCGKVHSDECVAEAVGKGRQGRFCQGHAVRHPGHFAEEDPD